MTLKIDKYIGRKLIAKKGETVTLVSDRGEVLIVKNKEAAFAIRKEDITE